MVSILVVPLLFTSSVVSFHFVQHSTSNHHQHRYVCTRRFIHSAKVRQTQECRHVSRRGRKKKKKKKKSKKYFISFSTQSRNELSGRTTYVTYVQKRKKRSGTLSSSSLTLQFIMDIKILYYSRDRTTRESLHFIT